MKLINDSLKNSYNYGNILNTPEGERWELIAGVPFDMTPTPPPLHQEILGKLSFPFANHLRNKSCAIYLAIFDVRLPESNEDDEDVTTVVQPDISIICDLTKIDDKGCRGCPDLVIEVSSPYTIQHDLIEKMDLYEKFKVKEYWIVHSVDEIVMVFTLQENNTYGRPQVYSSKDKITPGLFPDLTIDLTEVFDNH